jgi:hypothetical protein
MKKKQNEETTPLSRFLYIEVRGWSDSQGRVIHVPSIVTVEVLAEDEDAAYNVGSDALEARYAADPHADNDHNTGDFLNDFVVKL